MYENTEAMEYSVDIFPLGQQPGWRALIETDLRRRLRGTTTFSVESDNIPFLFEPYCKSLTLRSDMSHSQLTQKVPDFPQKKCGLLHNILVIDVQSEI